MLLYITSRFTGLHQNYYILPGTWALWKPIMNVEAIYCSTSMLGSNCSIQGFFPSFDFLSLIPPSWTGMHKGNCLWLCLDDWWVLLQNWFWDCSTFTCESCTQNSLHQVLSILYIYVHIYIDEYMRFFLCMVHRDLLGKSVCRHIEIVLVHLSAVARRFTVMVQKRVPLLRGLGGDVQDVWGFHHWWRALCKSPTNS